MAKRRPGTDLNHDNWDKEEEAEDAGQFQQASLDTIKERKIIRPKRRLGTVEIASTPSNPFAAFSGFTVTTTTYNSDLPNPNMFTGFNFEKPISPTLANSDVPYKFTEEKVEASAALSSDGNTVAPDEESLGNASIISVNGDSCEGSLPDTSNISSENEEEEEVSADQTQESNVDSVEEGLSLSRLNEPDSTCDSGELDGGTNGDSVSCSSIRTTNSEDAINYPDRHNVNTKSV